MAFQPEKIMIWVYVQLIVGSVWSLTVDDLEDKNTTLAYTVLCASAFTLIVALYGQFA